MKRERANGRRTNKEVLRSGDTDSSRLPLWVIVFAFSEDELTAFNCLGLVNNVHFQSAAVRALNGVRELKTS